MSAFQYQAHNLAGNIFLCLNLQVLGSLDSTLVEITDIEIYDRFQIILITINYKLERKY